MSEELTVIRTDSDLSPYQDILGKRPVIFVGPAEQAHRVSNYLFNQLTAFVAEDTDEAFFKAVFDELIAQYKKLPNRISTLSPKSVSISNPTSTHVSSEKQNGKL